MLHFYGIVECGLFYYHIRRQNTRFLCNDKTVMLKEYNLHQHYLAKTSPYSYLTGRQPSEKLEQLKLSISLQQNFFTKVINENEIFKKCKILSGVFVSQ